MRNFLFTALLLLPFTALANQAAPEASAPARAPTVSELPKDKLTIHHSEKLAECKNGGNTFSLDVNIYVDDLRPAGARPCELIYSRNEEVFAIGNARSQSPSKCYEIAKRTAANLEKGGASCTLGKELASSGAVAADLPKVAEE